MIQKMMQSEFNEMVRLHHLWLIGDAYGDRADFSHKVFSNITAHNLDLKHCIFYDTIAQDTNFNGTNFTGANLINSDFSRSDFSNSSMKEASLKQSGFNHVVFDNVNLWNTTGDGRYIVSLQCSRNMIAYTATHLQIHWHQLPIDDWWNLTDDELRLTALRPHNEELILDKLAWWAKWKHIGYPLIKLGPAKPFNS